MEQTTARVEPLYRRILLKLSGEALQGDHLFGIDASKLSRIAQEIIGAQQLGVQVALVVGGGNLIRGADLCAAGLDRIAADQMGMLATVINGLALRDALERKSIPVTLMSAFGIPSIAEQYDRSKAQEKLQQGHVVIFSAGTGNPLVTTDSAAALRGIEIGADIVLKATKVEGVFDDDPIKNPKAERFEHLSYEEVISKRLGVMDLTAILLCQDHGLPLRVFNMNKQGALKRIMLGEDIGTMIKAVE
ncbi:UMP kinase [Aquicella lusitana]|uniref:Uridylate kinase n=1 Tax=Aquicella lusitana TaxID=254246 RepID=A0A370GDA3_9COXI|nr:UMP kinase [Aquicella lusitana]RDI41805.1 uridylate kinase [Aquicella lusitana]VVC73713.1 Uridylate kinase [Aquicella lusitana]